jgi:protein ImuA
LQLAVEKSHVTGFIIRNDPRNMNVNACVSRWRISPIPSGSENNLPGVGFPRWNIELLKIRNGRPGSWQMEWSYNLLHSISNPVELLVQEEKRKAG